MRKRYVFIAVALLAVASLVSATSVFAKDDAGSKSKGMMRPAVFGTVSSISGNTLTVASRQFGKDKKSVATTTYTVDATNATVFKNNATSTVASIASGDNVVVQGTVSGTNVAATVIRDGQKNKISPITGNGQPVVAGTISSLSGLTIVITNKSNVTYTVDATSAKVLQGKNTISVSNLSVGENVVIQGTVNGNSVVASTVIDQTKPAMTSGTAKPAPRGFFGGIGQFFSHLFGF